MFRKAFQGSNEKKEGAKITRSMGRKEVATTSSTVSGSMEIVLIHTVKSKKSYFVAKGNNSRLIRRQFRSRVDWKPAVSLPNLCLSIKTVTSKENNRFYRLKLGTSMEEQDFKKLPMLQLSFCGAGTCILEMLVTGTTRLNPIVPVRVKV